MGVINQSWEFYRSQIGGEFQRAPGEFLRQSMITTTLAPDNAPLTGAYASDLRRANFGLSLLARAIDPPHGAPRRYQDGLSMVAAQHAWQLARLWEFLAIQPRDLLYIAEIGGGYGDMCRQVRAGGFKGTYRIFDLPELLALQAHYLALCEAAVTLLPLQRAALASNTRASLLLGTFSLAEMTLEERADIEPSFGSYGYLMLAWNESFAGIDNIAWFAGLQERLRPDYTVTMMKDPYMRAWYLFAKRRK